MFCFRDSRHQNPEGARFCIECGMPLQQVCPYNGSHWMGVRDDANATPKSCPGCRQLLTGCPDCGRLYRIDETVCLTGACGRRTLPPLRMDWSGWAGGPARRGLGSRSDRGACSQEGVEWSGSDGPVALISAYGNLYQWSANRIDCFVAPRPRNGPPQDTLQVGRSLLRQPGGSVEPIAFSGGQCALWALTPSEAIAIFPYPMTIQQRLSGRFSSQIGWGPQWLLWGTLGMDARPEAWYKILCVGETPQQIPGSEGLAPYTAPVALSAGVVWAVREGRLMIYRGNEVEPFARDGVDYGMPLALAVGVEGEPSAGVYLLAQGATGDTYLHQFAENGVHLASTPVEAAEAVRRIWVSSTDLFLARNRQAIGATSDGPAMLKYDPRFLGQEPKALEWPAAYEFLDALVIEDGPNLRIWIGIRDTNRNASYLYDRPWSGADANQKGVMIGAKSMDLICHDGWVLAALTDPTGYKIWERRS